MIKDKLNDKTVTDKEWIDELFTYTDYGLSLIFNKSDIPNIKKILRYIKRQNKKLNTLTISDTNNLVEIGRLRSKLCAAEDRNKELEIALMDMILQFADRSNDEKVINPMGLSALENAFAVLDLNYLTKTKDVEKRMKKLMKEREKYGRR